MKRGRQGGMTLVELLLVISLLSLILGTGLGLFASLNPGRRAALGSVASVLRSAHNSAIARGAPARVRFDEATGGFAAEAQRVIGTWHFEDETLAGAFGIDGAAIGLDAGFVVDEGYQGRALSFRGQPKGARVEMQVQRDPAWSLAEGFRIDCAVRLEEPRGANLLDVGRSVALAVTSTGSVQAAFVPEALGELGRAVPGEPLILRSGEGELALGRWARVRAVYDRRRFELFVDGVQVAGWDEEVAVWPLEGPLVLSGGSVPFAGSIDNLAVSAVVRDEPQKLPEGVRFAPGTPAEVAFAAGGALEPALHRTPVEVPLAFDDGSSRTLRVSLYGTVE